MGSRATQMALASFWMGCVGLLAWLALFAAIKVEVGNGATPHSEDLNYLGLALFAGLGVNLAGAILAVASLVRGQRVTPFAIAGLTANGLELLLVLLLALAGLVQQLQ